MSELEAIQTRGIITKREALAYLLAIRKKIDIMSATLIDSASDSFEKEEIDKILHSFFYG